MRRIGDFIGIDPDKTRLDPGDIVDQFMGRYRAVEMSANSRIELADKGAAATELHLKKQALTLVDPHGARHSGGLSSPILWQRLLVTGMTRFVNSGGEGRDKVIFRVATGQADITGHATAKWVRADIQAPLVEIKSQVLHHLSSQQLLVCYRVVAGAAIVTLVQLFMLHFLDKFGQPVPHRSESGLQPFTGHAGFKSVQQGIVTCLACVRRASLGFFSHQGDYRLEIGAKPLPIVVMSLFAPLVFTAITRQRLGLHQVPRHGYGLGIVPAHLSEIGPLFDTAFGGLGFGAIQPFGKPGRGF